MTPAHTWKCYCRWWRQQSCKKYILTDKSLKKKKKNFCIGVTLFLLLTAASDQKINLVTKLYLFLSLASLLIFCLVQIGFSYKPERCTFLQPNLKSCAEKISLKAHCGSVCWCVSCRLGFLLQCAFDALPPLWPLTARANSLGLLSPFFQGTSANRFILII